MSILYAILGFALLIVLHEAGHMWVARAVGMRVTAFSVGFGPKLLGFERGGTEYKISALPLGGYVQIVGLGGEEDPQSDEADDPQAFYNRPRWARALVLLAGPVTNYLTAALILYLLLVAGFGTPDPRAVIGELTPELPAAEAGLQPGDIVTRVDGVGTATFREFADAVAERPNQPTVLTVLRGDQLQTITLTPAPVDDGSRGRVGVMQGTARIEVQMGPLDAIPASVGWVFEKNAQMLSGIASLITRETNAEPMGPVGIVQATAQQASQGFVPLLQFLAILSIALGLFNLLPVPALDGGRVVFVLVESVIRRSIPQRVETLIHSVGLLLLLALLLFVTYGDIRRLLG